ncbi:MAG: hypothetical protein ACYC5G_04205 [Candidatus Doudnabacteria bacterium]
MDKESQPNLDKEINATPALNAELAESDAVKEAIANWEKENKNQELAHAINVLVDTGATYVMLNSYLENKSEDDSLARFEYVEFMGLPFLELILDENKEIVGVRRKSAGMVS